MDFAQDLKAGMTVTRTPGETRLNEVIPDLMDRMDNLAESIRSEARAYHHENTRILNEVKESLDDFMNGRYGITFQRTSLNPLNETTSASGTGCTVASVSNTIIRQGKIYAIILICLYLIG